MLRCIKLLITYKKQADYAAYETPCKQTYLPHLLVYFVVLNLPFVLDHGQERLHAQCVTLE